MKGIPFIIPCLNRFDMFTETIETIDTPITPIVIDCWRNNRGVSGAWNEGMKRVLDLGLKYAVITNDDVKFYPGSLRSIYEILVDEDAALVSPNQVRNRKVAERYETEGVRAGADFFCFAINVEQVVNNAGWFDTNFWPAYFEDNDMHKRMLLAGLKCLVDTESFVFHEVSKTQNLDHKNPVTNFVDFEDNKAYYALKWGGFPQSGKDNFTTPFNHPGLSVRDWPGAWKFDGLETNPSETIFNQISWKPKDVAPQIFFDTE